MRFARLALPLVCVLFAGCDIRGRVRTSGSGPEIVDYSGITSFEFSRTPAPGFCPPLDAVFSAEILVNDEGQYVLNMSVLEEGVVGESECLDDEVLIITGDCLVETQLAEQTLTSDQTDALRAVFSAVEVYDEMDPICIDVAIDPCVISVFTFDGTGLSAFPCAQPRLSGDSAGAITDLLEGFRGEG